MRNPTPAPIVVPASGAPTCRGVALRTVDLRDFERDGDSASPGDHYDLVRVWAGRAIHNGHVLCLRPTADRPACVGLTATMFADASLQAGFEARALVVDPYDADGNDLREVLPMRVPFNPEIRAGERVCDMDGNEYGVVSAKHAGGVDVECTTDLILRPVARMTFADLVAREAAAVAVWEASEAV